MRKRRKVNVKLCWAEHKVDSKLRTTLTLVDSCRPGRKVNVDIVLKDLPAYMVSHIAEQCMEALRKIEKQVSENIETVRNT